MESDAARIALKLPDGSLRRIQVSMLRSYGVLWQPRSLTEAAEHLPEAEGNVVALNAVKPRPKGPVWQD